MYCISTGLRRLRGSKTSGSDSSRGVQEMGGYHKAICSPTYRLCSQHC